jgi:hypothetical protein
MKTARLLVLSLIVLASAAAFAQSPVIVAQVSLLNQQNTIPTTTLVTPATNGVYRVSAYLIGSKYDNQNEWNVGLLWKDEIGQEKTIQNWLIAPNNQIPLYSQAMQILRATAGNPITYHVGVLGTPRGVTYNLFITVEQLESD